MASIDGDNADEGSGAKCHACDENLSDEDLGCTCDLCGTCCDGTRDDADGPYGDYFCVVHEFGTKPGEFTDERRRERESKGEDAAAVWATPLHMLPLWYKCPNFHPCCIGWRMGYGEQYKGGFIDAYRKLSDEEQLAYRKEFPEVAGWRGWYDDVSKISNS